MKSKTIRGIIYIICITSSVFVSAQEVVPLSQIVRNMLLYHPQALEAKYRVDQAGAELLKARGMFDPVVDFQWNQKNYEAKNYYQIGRSEIKIPTPLGIDIKTGYETNRGLFLNPESNTPAGGLLYAGLSASLLQGLVIDERRAGRKMAEIGMNIADEGLNVNNNNLVYQSVLHYLGWTQSYKSVILFRQAVGNVNQRLQAVRNQVLSGDRPGIDTVEVNIQRQLLEISLQEAEASLVQNRTMLNTFIWNVGLENVGLSPNDIPEEKIDTVGNVTSDITLETLVQNHPELRQYNLKLDQMDVERRLKTDKLKPNVVLSYNPLFEPVSESLVNNVTFENFKFGVSLYMPLYLRKERGDIRLINSKMNEVKMINLDKTTNIMAKYQAYVVEYNNVRRQLQILEETVILYRQMYEAEIQLFEIGESSLFLVNTREQNLIQSEIKRLELEIKMYKAYFGIFYVSGALPDFFN